MKRGLLVSIIVFSLLSPIVLAGSINIDVDNGLWLNETTIDRDNPTNNYYGGAFSYIENKTDTNEWYTYFTIDISGIPDSAIINDATIQLYGEQAGGTGRGDFVFSRVIDDSSVNYETMTWNTQPCGSGGGMNNDTACDITNKFTKADNTGFWVGQRNDFNLSTIIQDELCSGNDELTIVLRMENYLGEADSFRWTSMFGASGQQPYINVTFGSGTGVTPFCCCQDITVSGEYQLINDILSNQSTCIRFLVDDISLDLNGYMIQGDPNLGNDYRGINIQHGTAQDIHNSTVYGGYIDNFDFENGAGIRVGGADSVLIHDVVFTNNHNGIDGLVFGRDDDLLAENGSLIYENVFENNRDGININNGYHLLIYNNSLNNTDRDLDLTDVSNSSIVQNSFGKLEEYISTSCIQDNEPYIIFSPTSWLHTAEEFLSTTCVETISSVSDGADVGIYCDDCENNFIISNDIYAVKDGVFTGESAYNQFAHNVFLSRSGYYNGLYLEENTFQNEGCDNDGNIIDSGTNNLFALVCDVDDPTGVTLTEGYYCDNSDLQYVLSNGAILNSTVCSGGCQSDPPNSYCIGVIDESIEATRTDSILPLGSILGVSFLDVLFTPFTLLTLAILGLGAYLENSIDGNGNVFLGVLLVGSVGLTYLGIYPVWISIIVVVGLGYIIAQKMKLGG